MANHALKPGRRGFRLLWHLEASRQGKNTARNDRVTDSLGLAHRQPCHNARLGAAIALVAACGTPFWAAAQTASEEAPIAITPSTSRINMRPAESRCTITLTGDRLRIKRAPQPPLALIPLPGSLLTLRTQSASTLNAPSQQPPALLTPPASPSAEAPKDAVSPSAPITTPVAPEPQPSSPLDLAMPQVIKDFDAKKYLKVNQRLRALAQHIITQRDIGAARLLAWSSFHLMQWEQARQWFDQAYRWGKNAEDLEGLVRVELNARNYTRARQLAERLPNGAQSRKTLAEALFAELNAFYDRKEYARMIETVSQLKKGAPLNARTLEMLGWSHYGLQQYPQAAQRFAQSRALAPRLGANTGLKLSLMKLNMPIEWTNDAELQNILKNLPALQGKDIQ